MTWGGMLATVSVPITGSTTTMSMLGPELKINSFYIFFHIGGVGRQCHAPFTFHAEQHDIKLPTGPARQRLRTD